MGQLLILLVLGALVVLVRRKMGSLYAVPAWYWLLGTGLVLLVVGAISMFISYNEDSKAQDMLRGGSEATADEFQEANDNASLASTIGFVAGGIGALAIVSSLVMRNGGSATVSSVGEIARVRSRVQ